ncbi:hypothetical protein M378DRAFT_165718 [Amanita muscaria Koide BX008]|uniref:Nephrocystin 3-like N-terminal domain-containing protein n=1 Tax=Amanita muscaria (strain Koide BX008) TaxID=946122 RepID=A0A0C2T7G3_AMAMK|nr:hypothetical protein M378DRAFT_165718 [Amanita muscaria Koide BX008]
MEQFNNDPQHPIHPRNRNKQCKVPMVHIFRRFCHRKAKARVPSTNAMELVALPSEPQIAQFYKVTCLEKMEKFVSFTAQVDSSAQDPERICHPGTRQNVLKRMKDWIANDPSSTERITWLHGPAGAGKSAIAQTIAKSCGLQKVAATFFFFKSDPSRNDGNRLFPTLAYQLAFSFPAIKDHIVEALHQRPDLPTKSVEMQFNDLIALPLRSLGEAASKQSSPGSVIGAFNQCRQLAPVIIIDGVDECMDDKLQQRFLKIVGNAVKDHSFPFRFLICSRSEAHIEDTINQFKTLTLPIDLAKLDDANRDIEKYLVDEFFRIASKRHLSTTWPGPAVIQDIIYKSSGNFIFASVIIKDAGDEDNMPEDQIDIILNLKPPERMSPFAALDELYLDILRRQLYQNFLKTFLALLVGRTELPEDHQKHEDHEKLTNQEKEKRHTKLPKKRSQTKLHKKNDVQKRDPQNDKEHANITTRKAQKTQGQPRNTTNNHKDAKEHRQPAENQQKQRATTQEQREVDLLVHLIDEKYILGQYKPDAIRKATQLVLNICSTIPILPRSLFLNAKRITSSMHEVKAGMYGTFMNSMGGVSTITDWDLDDACKAALVGRVLDHNYICIEINLRGHSFFIPINIQPRSDKWQQVLPLHPITIIELVSLKSLNRCFSHCLQVLDVAKAIQYLHSMGLAFRATTFDIGNVDLDLSLRPRIRIGAELLTLINPVMKSTSERLLYEESIFGFGCFFYQVYFNKKLRFDESIEDRRRIIVERPSSPKISEYVWQLIQRCCAEDPRSRPTIGEVVKEMETWRNQPE